MMPAATRELDEVAKCVGRFWETNAEPLTRVPSPSDGAHSLRRRGMSPPATPRADAALASVAGVGPGDPPASAGDTRGDRGGGDAPSASGVSAPAESPETARGDVAFHGGERSPPPRDPADESFEAGGGGLEDADASPSAKGREEDVLDDGEGDGDGRADVPSSPRRVRTPDLKLRRPKPKQSAYHVVIKPRTPSPEPPTPVPSNPSTPAPSESDSESEDDTPPSPPPPPPKPADARLRGKKLRLTVLGVRNAPVGLGDVFCVVECGTSVLETTQPAPPPNAAPVQTAASSFEIFFDAPGASGDVAVIAFGEKGTPRLNENANANDDAPRSSAVSDLYHPIELARVTLSAYDFLPDGDLDDAFVERLGVVDVGDWVPMRRPRSLEKVVKKKYAGASVPVATTSARLVARLVDADHVESWEAERVLAEAVARVHEAAETGDGEDAQAAFDGLANAFAVKTLPAKAVKAWTLTSTKMPTTDCTDLETNGAGAFYARACLDVPYTAFRFTEADGGVPRTALARACARPTPAGEASALRFLALGATPSVSFPVDASLDGSWRKKKEAPVRTAAHVAARSNNARVLTRMLELDSAGVVSARDGEGYPALHVAVVARAAEAAEALLNGGADPAIQIRARVFSARRNPPSRDDDKNDDDDERPTSTAPSFVALNAFELAARSGDARVVDAVFGAGGPNEKKSGALKKNGSEESLAAALFAAARVGNARAANLAAARIVAGDFLGDDPGSSVRRNPDDPEGTNRLARLVLFTRNHLNKTVLETAAGRGAAEVIRVLQKRAASPARRTPRRGGDDGAGAMAWAAYARSDEAIEAVLAAGVTARDEWAAACRVAETRGASMRARRVLRGRASGT